MAKRRYSFDEDKLVRFTKEGRGQGTGGNYKPWLTIQDVPSRGRAARPTGWKTGRVHHFLSDIETETAGAFVTGGGYKYAQWGEGVCFLRVPDGCELRPVYTGWFADFAHLGDRRDDAPVAYEREGAHRFAGSTYDPSSHYRAREVIRFFEAQGLTVPVLREVSLRQTGLLFDALEAAGWKPATPRDPSLRGGFVSVRVADSAAVVDAMRGDEVYVDARGELLRFGPAPYVTDAEIERAVAAFTRAARKP